MSPIDRFPFRAAIVCVIYVIVIFWMAIMGGCKTGQRVPSYAAPVQSAPVLAGQEGKDSAVLSEAAKIDAIAPAAKPHTDAQRAAVAAAPAADVAKLVREFEAQVAALNKAIITISKERDDARNKTDKVILIGGYGIAALLVAAGVASFFLAAQLAFLGPKIGFALIAAGSSIFAMLQAYQFTKAHPWVVGVTLLILVFAGGLALANHHHAKE